ncbi:allene oxide cyclase barrel-like domain-containing protein [Pyxidicoccus caerfyrddinensis]|uniref:allene oxide cyclase barrel-like domain-containing protein n=1 Tax=Pyxidicoccus caerfyrddinensis TaxID=2709663 RepID=UPI001F072B45|nr:dirigent protein [Pyxidicoccus caerfyrddinensis]
MRKLSFMAVLAVPAAAQLLGCSSAHAEETNTLTTIADARSGIASPVDLGAPGDSPGDMFVFDQPLLNEARETIGSNSGYCIRTLPGQFSECQWTLTMADGTITVAGREAETGTSLIPIIGGTGDYLGVGGVLSTTPNGDRTFTQVLTLHRMR